MRKHFANDLAYSNWYGWNVPPAAVALFLVLERNISFMQSYYNSYTNTFYLLHVIVLYLQYLAAVLCFGIILKRFVIQLQKSMSPVEFGKNGGSLILMSKYV